MTEQITPWSVADDEVDYEKIIKEFGCNRIEKDLLDHIEKLTQQPVNHLLKRGIVFAHRDLHLLLDKVEKKENFYLYTGRGPSTKSLHIGHAIPFLLCKYLQDAFDVPIVIQITDDEKFLFKDLDLESTMDFATENIKDIIAFGFNPEKTFIFKNVEIYEKPNSTGFNNFFQKELKLAKEISFHEGSKIFGFDGSSNLGQVTFPVRQILPCYYNTFSFLKKSTCLVPAAIDQDPYFRLARDKAKIFKCAKPSTIYSGFLPSLGNVGKMSSSADKTIFLDDSQDDIAKKIRKHAFSGGRDTLAEHRRLGGVPEKDTSFQYLRFFLKDEEEMLSLEQTYRNGTLTSKEMKDRCIKEIQTFVEDFQLKRSKITQEMIDRFMSSDKKFYWS